MSNIPLLPIYNATSNNLEVIHAFQLLQEGEGKTQLSQQYTNVTLILGNTGSGKTAFTQWIAGDNDKLLAKEVHSNTGKFIIEDGNRIGNSTIKSMTTFPELVVDAKTNSAYYDLPGFSDTRSTSHEITTTYCIKKVADHAENIKMIFIISYPSLQKGVDRQDFMKLLRHTTDLIKDISKFQDSIALVATKVDNQYVKINKNLQLVTDDKIIESIADFLQEVRQGLEERIQESEVFSKEKNFCKNAIKFIDILLTNSTEGCGKIGIFRRPDEAGALSNITLLQEGKKNIEKILYKGLNFTAKNDDFGYTVSDRSKNDISALVEEINKNVWSNVSHIIEQTQNYYHSFVAEIHNKIQSFVTSVETVFVTESEAHNFATKINAGYNVSSKLVDEVKKLTSIEELAEKLETNPVFIEINSTQDAVHRN